VCLDGATVAHLPRISSRSSVVSKTASTAVLPGVDEVFGAPEAQVSSISNYPDGVQPWRMCRRFKEVVGTLGLEDSFASVVWWVLKEGIW
jgi:hypothetical protein